MLPATPPYATFSGLVTQADDKNATWDMILNPYYSFALNDQLPLHATILDSPQWKQGSKPTPHSLSVISAEGWLSDITREPESGNIQHYSISIQNVTFLGKGQPFITPGTPSCMFPVLYIFC